MVEWRENEEIPDSMYGICRECRKNLNMRILRKTFWIQTDRKEACNWCLKRVYLRGLGKDSQIIDHGQNQITRYLPRYIEIYAQI